MPRVSVIIPAYKVTAYIAEALQSVFSQTFTDFEVILVNDGCPDTANLENVLAPFLDRIVYLKQENGGAAAARNTGLKQARGEFLALLDGDDKWEPLFLERHLAAIGDAELRYGNLSCFGLDRLAGQTLMREQGEGTASLGDLISGEKIVLNSGTVVRRQAVVAAGGWDSRMPPCEDFHLWLRIAALGGKVAYTSEVLGHYRVRDDSASANSIRTRRARIKSLEDVQRMPLSDAERRLIADSIMRSNAEIELELGHGALAAGRTAEALEHLESATRVLEGRKLKSIVTALRYAPWAVQLAYRTRASLSSAHRDRAT